MASPGDVRRAPLVTRAPIGLSVGNRRSSRRDQPGAHARAEPSSNKAVPVYWDQFHRDARALAWRLADKGPFEAMVCITRGGLVPAAIICRELGLRMIETVCVASYHDYRNQTELKVLKDIAPNIKAIGDGKGKGVLVVDDLTDTGKTARVVREMLPNAHFATVYAKPAGVPLSAVVRLRPPAEPVGGVHEGEDGGVTGRLGGEQADGGGPEGGDVLGEVPGHERRWWYGDRVPRHPFGGKPVSAGGRCR